MGCRTAEPRMTSATQPEVSVNKLTAVSAESEAEPLALERRCEVAGSGASTEFSSSSASSTAAPPESCSSRKGPACVAARMR